MVPWPCATKPKLRDSDGHTPSPQIVPPPVTFAVSDGADGVIVAPDSGAAAARKAVFPASEVTSAAASPEVGLFLETVGAIALVIASGCGLLLGRPPMQRRSASAS